MPSLDGRWRTTTFFGWMTNKLAMLPTGFHDVTAFIEVSLATWRSVLEVAGESTRLDDESLTHERLWKSLTADPPGKEFLDALAVIHELGTDAGRDLIQQAASDQQASLGASDDVPARELAARIWIQSRGSSVLADVLVRARVNTLEAAHSRPYREFVGKSAHPAGPFDRERLKVAVSKWLSDNQKNEAIQVYAYERDGEWRCEILRSDALRRVVEIRDGRPAILDFRPAASDHIRYDPETGRIGIATHSPRLIQMYRDVLGSLLANDAEFFSGENICTLRPLQESGQNVLERHRPIGILHVDVVELRWRRGDRDKIWVRGRDCFKILSDLGARLNEGELIEAKLSIAFAGGGRRGHATIKVPNRIEIKAGMNERLVERLLDDAGIRGAFGTEQARGDFWDLHPWRMPEDLWRRHVGPEFDRLLRTSILRHAYLESTTPPDHLAFEGALTSEAVDAETIVGTSDDPAIGLRTLTSSDLMGYELDVACLVREIALALRLDGASSEITSGVWYLGRRPLSSTATLAAFLVTRRPSDEACRLIREAAKGLRVVLLVPHGCNCTLDLPQITCCLWSGRHDLLINEIVERLELQDEIPPSAWLREDLILDEKRGQAWYRGIELGKLRFGSHPFAFAVVVARAQGRVVKKEDLTASLSPARRDDEVAKKAKADFVAAVKASFEGAGVTCPSEVGHIFVSRGGGYALTTSAKVLS